MLSFFVCKVKYFDEIDEKDAEGKILCAAGNWNELMDKLTTYYGDNNIIKVETEIVLDEGMEIDGIVDIERIFDYKN